VERAYNSRRMANAPEVMNIRQVSQYLGVSPDTLYTYIHEEKVPAFKLGNRWKFKKSMLDAWMERKSHDPQASRREKLRVIKKPVRSVSRQRAASGAGQAYHCR